MYWKYLFDFKGYIIVLQNIFTRLDCLLLEKIHLLTSVNLFIGNNMKI